MFNQEIQSKQFGSGNLLSVFRSFPFVPPVRYAALALKESVPLHSKSLCKNTARASGCANNEPIKLGGGGLKTEKIPFFYLALYCINIYYMEQLHFSLFKLIAVRQ